MRVIVARVPRETEDIPAFGSVKAFPGDMARKKKNSWADLGFPQRLSATVTAAKAAGKIKSVSGLARAVGVSGSQIDRWKSGENDPALGAVQGLGVQLGVHPWWLGFGDNASHAISSDRLYDSAIRAILEMVTANGPAPEPRRPRVTSTDLAARKRKLKGEDEADDLEEED